MIMPLDLTLLLAISSSLDFTVKGIANLVEIDHR